MRLLRVFSSFVLFFIFGCSKKDYKLITPKKKFGEYTFNFISLEKSIDFTLKEGKERFLRSIKGGYSDGYFQLARFISSQVYPADYGLAAVKVVLSAIYKEAGYEFPLGKQTTLLESKNSINEFDFYFTERNIFQNPSKGRVKKGPEHDVATRQKVTPEGKLNGEISSQVMVNILNSWNGVKAEPLAIDTPSLEDLKILKEKIIDLLKNNKAYVIVNYHPGMELKITNKHFAILGGYDKNTDSALLLSPLHCSEWKWIKLDDLLNSMNSAVNGFSGRVIVVKKIEQKEIIAS